MSDISSDMASLAAALATALPARVVTRSYRDIGLRRQADLQAGIYTVIARAESDFTHYLGREAQFGKRSIAILGQFQLASDSEPSDIEDAESVMVDEIKGFLADLSPDLASLELHAVQLSAQLEHPFGWVAFGLEMMP